MYVELSFNEHSPDKINTKESWVKTELELFIHSVIYFIQATMPIET